MTIALKTELLGKSRDITLNKDGIAETLFYRVEGSNDPEEVINNLTSLGFIIGGIHPIFGALGTLDSVNVVQDGEAPSYCLLTAEFTPPESSDKDFDPETGEAWDFDMVAKQSKINSVESQTVDLAKTYGRQWDGQGVLLPEKVDTAIGRNGDRVEGATVYRPAGAARCTKKFDDKASIGAAERALIYGLQGQTNNGLFIDWDVEECLFLGASIRYPGDATAEVTYNFLFGKPQDVTVDLFYPGAGGAIMTPVNIGIVNPFEILAFTMGKRTDPTDVNKIVTGPERVGIYTVYKQADLSQLNLVGP